MRWTWASASCRGTSHVKAGTKCEDASRTALAGRSRDVLIVVASDGAGSAIFGGQGAVLVCRTIADHALAHFKAASSLPSDDQVAGWLDVLRDRIARCAISRAAQMRDFAATLVCALVTPTEALLLHVGDGAVVVRREATWQTGSWPEAGEYASTTYFVTDEAGPRLRITRLDYAPDAIALLTDGLERLVLDFTQRVPHGPFFERMAIPISASAAAGRDHGLSKALATYLDSAQVNDRTDDDKTLVIATRR